MALEIKAGDWAVLRDGTVPDGPLIDDVIGFSVKERFKDLNGMWRRDGLADMFRLFPEKNQQYDIIATFATRAEALAYVEPDPDMGDNHPDGPDLASVPQTVPAKEAVAARYDFDGYGWKYLDNGSGSDWKERATLHEDCEWLYVMENNHDS